ncbi:hypothetical protein Ancab_035032, partial [Ancistrocladus abbreviatus]
ELATRWGSFISLDDNTSKKERLDMARMLIATECPGFINETVQLSVDQMAFTIQVNEELLRANLFNHMSFYNVDGHGVSSEVSVSEKGRPSSPLSSSVQTHGKDSQLQSCTPAPISSEQRWSTEAMNGTATKIDATEGSVGSSSKAVVESARGVEEHAGRSNHINEKNCLFDGKEREGSYNSVPRLSVMGKVGEIKHCVLGQMSDVGLVFVVEDRSVLDAGEGLGLVNGPSQPQIKNWMGFGKYGH